MLALYRGINSQHGTRLHSLTRTFVRARFHFARANLRFPCLHLAENVEIRGRACVNVLFDAQALVDMWRRHLSGLDLYASSAARWLLKAAFGYVLN